MKNFRYKNNNGADLEITYPPDLPISARKDEIIQLIRENQVLILAGETGSGKTTQLPKICLEAGLGSRLLIGCTQPRRIAAITVAARVALELGDHERLLVGHKIRFQDRTGKATRIKFMTDGILLAEARRDRSLRQYDTIIVDEAHERSLNIDFLLGILRQLLPRRRDLKVIITSATIDTEKFAASFTQAPIINISGRNYPVEVRYQPLDSETETQTISYIDRAVEAVAELRSRERPGDILIFMPTERDVRETVESLRHETQGEHGLGRWSMPTILPLFGRLSGPEQSKIFQPHSGNKIVVATNVAETSLTVPGIRYVIDTGLARISSYNVRAKTTRMPVAPISRAAADQRLGRCGRIAAGICIRLFAEEDYLHRPEFTTPEIQRSNLAEVILRMHDLGLGDPADFPFIDPPSSRAIKDGYSILFELEAFDPALQNLTRRGRFMAKLPLDPRISRMIMAARELHCLREVVIIAAALSIQDPRVRPADKEAEADLAHSRFLDPASDYLTYLNIWNSFQQQLANKLSKSRFRKFCQGNFLSWQRLREWQDIHQQIWGVLAAANCEQAGNSGPKGPARNPERLSFRLNREPAAYDAIHQAILSGNLRHIAMKKEKNCYIGAHGKEIHIFPGSGQINRAGAWIMAAELVETSRLFARTVSRIKPEWLEALAAHLCRYSYSSPRWEKKAGMVTADEKVSLFGLVIVASRRVNFGRINPEEAREIFIQAALVEGQLQGRHPFLHHNLGLIKQLEELENRVRRRDILVDEQLIYDFYEKRLPPPVFDLQGLRRLIRQRSNDHFLKMGQEDIIGRQPDGDELSRFPETINSAGLEIKLSYRFAPGRGEDGVTAVIPATAADTVQPETFDWLVPGLLEEKITFLLKGLPKNLRKNLVPIPQTVRHLLAEIRPFHGSLCRALEKIILRDYRLKIEAANWPLSDLPEHLKMHFHLVDNGVVLDKGCDLHLLSRERAGHESCDQRFAALKSQWERENIRDWDFSGLEEKIQVLDATGLLAGYLYPALVLEASGNLALRLCRRLEEARQQTRQGLLRLYLLHLPAKEHKSLEQEIALPSASWALYEGFSGRQELNLDLKTLILEEFFQVRPGVIPSREEFNTRLARAGAGLFRLAGERRQMVLAVLTERRAVMDAISRYEKMAGGANRAEVYQNFRSRLHSLIPLDFLRRFEPERLAQSSRYLKGLLIRFERFQLAPAKDTVKASQIKPFANRLEEFRQQQKEPGAEAQKALAAYEQMLEEFHISLFAQELKTLYPVSAKRLEDKWLEFRDAAA